MDTDPAYDVLDPGCPSRLVLQRLGDKWTPLVLLVLRAGPQRFTELRGGVGGVTAKVLTQTLRLLERDGLVTRKAYAEIPPRVEYALTDLGRSLLGPFDELAGWAQAHAGHLQEARDAYDARVEA